MGNYCGTEASCCTSDNITEHNLEKIQSVHQTSSLKSSYTSISDIIVSDENQLRKLESMTNAKVSGEIITSEICSVYGVSAVFELLRQENKSFEMIEKLLVRDKQLSFNSIEFGCCLKYLGQTRSVRKYKGSEQAKQGGNSEDNEIVKCGYGVLQWPDGSVFEGYWLNGQAISIGVFKTPKKEIFEGMWIQDKSTGLDVFRKTNSTDRQTGKGVEVWSDGSYYFGDFNDGMKQGNGVYYWADGSRYSGDWLQDEMSGRGSFEWADGRSFQGSFKNGVMHGYGTYTWQDGRKYEGNYSLNKKHGMGTYTYSDGSRYQGEWVDGLQHGNGSILEADSGIERKGIWANGKLKNWQM